MLAPPGINGQAYSKPVNDVTEQGADPAAEPARRRRRDPEGHRAAILHAARQAFAEHGYTRATMRDIAHRAGVTHGLISRQFTSKEQLFLAAVPGHRDLERAAAGDPAALPERLARAFVQRMETDAANDPLVTLVRSAASNEQAATRLLAAMQQHSTEVYRAVLSAGDAPVAGDLDIRVALVGSHMIGVTFNRYIAKTEPLASIAVDDLIEHVARTLRQILFG